MQENIHTKYYFIYILKKQGLSECVCSIYKGKWAEAEVESIRLLIPPQSSKSFLRLPPARWEDFSIKLQHQTFTCPPLFPVDKKSLKVEVNMNRKHMFLVTLVALDSMYTCLSFGQSAEF